MNFNTLLSFLTASALLTILPGPDIIYVMIQSVSNGKKQGIDKALGLVSGIIFHTSLIAFGVSELLKHKENIYFTIKLFGALYLFYLAYKVYKSSLKINLDLKPEKKTLFSLYKQGLLMNVLNPKVGIFFLAFFPSFIQQNTSISTFKQIYLLGFTFMLQAFLLFCLVAFLADKMAFYLRNNKSFEKRLKIIQIIVFIGIGIFILL